MGGFRKMFAIQSTARAKRGMSPLEMLGAASFVVEWMETNSKPGEAALEIFVGRRNPADKFLVDVRWFKSGSFAVRIRHEKDDK